MNLRLSILSLTLISLCLGACRPEPQQDRLLVYIMAGQSNMAGRGIVAPEDTLGDPRILTIGESKDMIVAKEPLHFYSPAISGLDCGMSFATSLLERAPAGTRICLVPAAIGSSSVEEWLGDSLRVVRMFSNAVSRAEVAVSQGGTLAGILWHQGESNAESPERAAGYALRLDSLVLRFRTALNRPDLPFFAATLADFCIRPCKDSINRAIEGLSHRIPAFVLVDAAALTGKPDSLHFDAAAQRALGRRFATAAAAFL